MKKLKKGTRITITLQDQVLYKGDKITAEAELLSRIAGAFLHESQKFHDMGCHLAAEDSRKIAEQIDNVLTFRGYYNE